MKGVEYTFCMKQFKPAIAGLAVLVVVVLGWTGRHCSQKREMMMELSLAAAAQPAAPPIRVRGKMLHPYWGSCNKCHVTVNAGKPVSKVMAGPPISIKDKMLHDYWGNCLLCHTVTDGFQPKKSFPKAKAAAANRLTAPSLGLKAQAVTGAMMRQLGLANEDGVLILEVAPNSLGAHAGLRKGDEIIRAGKIRLDTLNDLETALNQVKPGGSLKLIIFRGKKQRSLFVKLPKDMGNLVPAAATAPMTQNQIETLAEQLGVPKTQQDVARAALNLNYGKVAVAVQGPGIDYPISPSFGSSPYFIVFDPGMNSFRVVANPNANDVTGKGVQTGQYIVDLGASNAVAGSFNPNALHTLRTLRVNVFSGVVGSGRDAVFAYAGGNLLPNNAGPSRQAAVPGGNISPGVGNQKRQVIY